LGLPIAEAMLFNLPVITTAWGGQTDFCDENTAWLCDYRFTKADTHLGLTNSLWAEPDQAHLSVLLKQLHGLSDAQIRAKTELAKARVSQQLTWQKTAENMRQAVQTVQDQALLRIDPKIGWISTWNARCGIANYSQFLTQSFPQDRLTILANHIPERMDIDQPNVVRCWNAEYDENFDVAFEEIIERQIDTVVFQYNFGFCAIEHLASLIARLRERGIGMHIFFHSTADVAQNGQMRSLSEIANYLQQAERIYVHSADDMNRLKSWQIVDNVVCFPHGITPPSSSAHRINKAVFANKKVIASYGFLLPHKGVLQLIEAFAQLDHAQHDSHLLLVNALYPSPISNHEAFLCRELMRQLGIEEKVTFITEFLSDADTHYALSNADVIVFPYQKTQESSSAAVRVGLATGKPVLVTPLAIFADVDEAVHQLPGTSPEQIAIGLTKFFNQSAPSQEKQAQIAIWFAERSWLVLSTRLLNIIDGLANQLSDYPRNR
jgi:glycosyltransferase involved in cell wall biosynthesis